MSDFKILKDEEGKERLIYDCSCLQEEKQMGDKFNDFEILMRIGDKKKTFKVLSKINNKVYSMKILDLNELKSKGEKEYESNLKEIKLLEDLSHPNIAKHFKNFEENNHLYIIFEYISDTDLSKFIKAHKEMKKPLKEEKLWNIFLQMMWALAYIHSMGGFHGNIKPESISLDNNMRLVISDFGIYSSEIDSEEIQNIEICQKNDVYSMGLCFYELCYFHLPKEKKDDNNNAKYSEQLCNIVNSMLEQDKEKRENSKQIFQKILEEYSERYTKNSSIDSIFKCLNSFNSLFEEFSKIDKNILDKKEITNLYMNCLKLLRNEKNLAHYLYAIDYFKKKLISSFPNIEQTGEIDPKYIICFLFEKFQKELSEKICKEKVFEKEGPHLIISGEEVNKTNPNEIRLKYINELISEFNSPIISNFNGLLKVSNTCKTCNNKTYLFRSYLFAILDLKEILERKYITSLDIKENLKNPISTKKEIYCSKCLKKTMQDSEISFFSFPKLFIIYIERGAEFKLKTKIAVKDVLELDDRQENIKKKFKLVGLIRRKKNGDYFSISSYDQKWFFSEENNIHKIKSYNDNKEGDVTMLFYQEEGRQKQNNNIL